MVPAKNFLLEGLPRVGKTTVVQKVLGVAKVKFGGFYTQALDPQASQRDFKLVTLQGHNRTLSRKRLIRRFQVGNLIGLDLGDLESNGIDALDRALAGCQVVVIDEIGRHEALSVRFQKAVLRVLDSPLPVLATMPLYGTPFIEALKRRSDVTVFTVTEDNRVLLPERLALELTSLVRRPVELMVAGI